MEFERSDYDWSDWQKGLSPERLTRFEEVVVAIYARVLEVLREHHGDITMTATVPIGVFAKGVRGDNPSYLPIVILQAHRFPGYPRLQLISRELSNTLPVGRVIYAASEPVPQDLVGAMRRAGRARRL